MELFEQPVPDAPVLPVTESSPVCDAAGAQLVGEVAPGDACQENEDDAGEARAVVGAGPAALWARIALGDQRIEASPEFVGDNLVAHASAPLADTDDARCGAIPQLHCLAGIDTHFNRDSANGINAI